MKEALKPTSKNGARVRDYGTNSETRLIIPFRHAVARAWPEAAYVGIVIDVLA